MTRLILGELLGQEQFRRHPDAFLCDAKNRQDEIGILLDIPNRFGDPSQTGNELSMKKRTVITTEKREVWVIRDSLSEVEQPIDLAKVIEIASAVADPEHNLDAENLERNPDLGD